MAETVPLQGFPSRKREVKHAISEESQTSTDLRALNEFAQEVRRILAQNHEKFKEKVSIAEIEAFYAEEAYDNRSRGARATISGHHLEEAIKCYLKWNGFVYEFEPPTFLKGRFFRETDFTVWVKSEKDQWTFERARAPDDLSRFELYRKAGQKLPSPAPEQALVVIEAKYMRDPHLTRKEYGHAVGAAVLANASAAIIVYGNEQDLRVFAVDMTEDVKHGYLQRLEDGLSMKYEGDGTR